MKKIYDKHFRVLENEKIKEHVMKVRILFAVAIICAALSSMGITAYAFFSYTVTSSNNEIKSACFKLDKTVLDTTSNETVSVNKDGYYHLQNEEAHTSFQLKLVRSSKATASAGFAKIEIIAGTLEPVTYYTESITKTQNNEYIIEIAVPKGETVKVKITDNWGTCAIKGFDILNGTDLTPLPIPQEEVQETEPVLEEEEVQEEDSKDEIQEEEVIPEETPEGEEEVIPEETPEIEEEVIQEEIPEETQQDEPADE